MLLNLKSDQSHMIMMCGLPASGKSTWVKHFLKETKLQWEICSTDDIIMEYAKENGLLYHEAFRKISFKDVVEKQFFDKINQCMNEGKNIIIDQTNISKKSRQKKLRLIPESYIKIAVVFDLLEEERRERQIKRDILERKFVQNNVIDSMRENQELDLKDENFHSVIVVDK